MKNILIVLGAVIGMIFPAIAQLEEGVISYDIEVSSDDPQMSMVAGMMEGSTSETIFQGKKVRVEVDMGDVMAQTIIINEEETPQMLTLMDGMMGKYGIPTEKLDKVDDEEAPDFEVEVTGETKKIFDFECVKAIVTDEDGNEMIFWCTKEINPNASANKSLRDKLPGFPLEFEMYANKFHMLYTANDVSKKLPKKMDGMFSTKIPKGFKEVSKEDMKKMGM